MGEFAEQSTLLECDDPRHGWNHGSQTSAPDDSAVHKVFDEIMGEGPSEDDEQEHQWWQQLPLVTAVTGVLLRQQNRRRWKPTALAQMLALFPRLQELHYEPWREWFDVQPRWTDQCESGLRQFTLLFDVLPFRSLFESLASRKLQSLVLFEDFNRQYPLSFAHLGCNPIRTPDYDVSRAVANASLELVNLAASFMIEASYFFDARETSWIWPDLTSIALTSRLLAPDESPVDVENMLQEAAATSMKMPALKTMEIWNGQEGLAGLFRYQSAVRGQPAMVTWRGTWELVLGPPVIKAWETVALKHRDHEPVIVKELLDVGTVLMSHGDAIHQLRLSTPVICPVSLQQIRTEHKTRRGVRS